MSEVKEEAKKEDTAQTETQSSKKEGKPLAEKFPNMKDDNVTTDNFEETDEEVKEEEEIFGI